MGLEWNKICSKRKRYLLKNVRLNSTIGNKLKYKNYCKIFRKNLERQAQDFF